MSIEVKDLTKSYGEQRAIDNVSFAIDKGQIVGFLGPNGAGKSTTMKIITGYLQADSGKAFVGGIDVAAHPIAAKRKVGYLPESNPLYPDMYVTEYLSFVADVHKISRRKETIGQVIETVGLTREYKKKTGQLSKGYRQRVGLAAALLHNPEVLILDEPTTGLDPNQIVEIREVIRNLGENKTVLFSSHILQEVEAICDRVIIINRGKLVADDKLSTLRQRAAGSYFIRVHFKEGPSREAFQQLTAVSNINGSGGQGWELETTDPELLRKQLMELALRRNLNIVSLQSGEQSLEEIFRALTTQEIP